jgi:hypothetical protein
MAKKGGKSKGVASKGIHSNVSKKITKAMRKDYLASSTRIMNQMIAHHAGKNVVVTIVNPNKEETNRPFINVSSTVAWGNPKVGGFFIK